MNVIEKWLCLLLAGASHLAAAEKPEPTDDQKNPGRTEADCFERGFEEIATHK